MTRLGNLFLYSRQYTVIYLLIFVSINFCFRNVVFSVSSRLVFAARGEVYQPRQVWLRHPQDHAQEFVRKNFGKFRDSITPGTSPRQTIMEGNIARDRKPLENVLLKIEVLELKVELSDFKRKYDCIFS